MTKRYVTCPACGNHWETQSPFSKTMCPKCHAQAEIGAPKEEKK